MTPPDLLACIQVYRHWNSPLISYLWYIVNDDLYSWDDILCVCHHDNASRLLLFVNTKLTANTTTASTSSQEEKEDNKEASQRMVIKKRPRIKAQIERWLFNIFEKYSLHIRILQVSLPVLVRAAGIQCHCAHLSEMWAHPVGEELSVKDRAEELLRREQDRASGVHVYLKRLVNLEQLAVGSII